MTNSPRISPTSRGTTSITGILGLSLALVTLVPFLPIVWLTWAGYREDVARVEEAIQGANQHIAELAQAYLGGVLRQARLTLEASEAAGAAPLPEGPPAVQWERVASDRTVRLSSVDAARVGRPCGYEGVLAGLAAGTSSTSDVGRWVAGRAPTALVAGRTRAGDEALVAVLDPDTLHRELRALSGPSLDRHLYAVDRRGSLLFYSDPALSGRGTDLSANPPIRMHLRHQEGRIRFTSIVSGKARLGFVRSLDSAGWGVIVTTDIGARLLGLRDRALGLGWSILFALTAALSILLWTSRRLTRPVLAIRDSLSSKDRLPHRPLAVGLAARRVIEYDELVRAFDGLAERLAAAEAELVQVEKASLLGQLSSGLAHEMGTPLNVISGNAQYLLRRAPEKDPSREVLQLIVRQTERITTMIRRFLDFSRAGEARLLPVDLPSIVAQTLEMVPGVARDIQVVVESQPGIPPVLGDPKLLEHALLNLILNACQAMPEGGRLEVAVGACPPPEGAGWDGEWVCCRIADTGCGIAAEHIERVFEPFFTTKPQGLGTGLGLAIADRIVRQHGGRIEVRSQPGQGSVFSVRLRAAPPSARRSRLQQREDDTGAPGQRA